jgi:carbamoyl-phosphate synthase large subunit
VFFSLADRDKQAGLLAARAFEDLGFSIVATSGTAEFLTGSGVGVSMVVRKVGAEDSEFTEGAAAAAPTAVDLLADGKVSLVVNTPKGRGSRADGAYIRSAASRHGIPLLTTVSSALAAARGIADTRTSAWQVRTLQEYHGR